MDGKRVVVLVGFAVLVVAAVLALTPIRSHGESCGTVVNPPNLGASECGDARSSRVTVTLVAVATGVVLLVGASRVRSSAP